MILTHDWINLPNNLAWGSHSATPHPSAHRLEDLSADDFATVAATFLMSPADDWNGSPRPCMGRYRVQTGGTVSYVPPILSCGYHEPTGISLDIDPESGGGFVTRPAIPEALASGKVIPSLVRRFRSLLPAVAPAGGVDVYAVRHRGGDSHSWPHSRAACAKVALLIESPAPPASRPFLPPGAGTPRLRRPGDVLCWAGLDPLPTLSDVLLGASGHVLFFVFRS